MDPVGEVNSVDDKKKREAMALSMYAPEKVVPPPVQMVEPKIKKPEEDDDPLFVRGRDKVIFSDDLMGEMGRTGSDGK